MSYYSKDYIEKELDVFEEIGGSVFYQKPYMKEFLKLEERMVISIDDDFFTKQETRFPYGVIRDFLQVFPPLTKAERYTVERNFLVRSLDKEEYLTRPLESEIEIFNEYYKEGFDLSGKTAIADLKTAFTQGNAEMQAIGESMGIVFNLTDPLVRNRLNFEAGRRITGINETTRRLIINALITAYDNGEGYQGMKKEVKKLFASWKVPESGQVFTNKRAEMIARTELGMAVSWARDISYQKRDVRRKSWLAEPNACPVCVLASSNGTIDFNSQFSNGFMSPLAHPNCRCVLLPEVSLQDYLKGYTWHGEADNGLHTQF